MDKKRAIRVDGSNFEQGVGSSEFVRLKIDDKNENPLLGIITNAWGVSREDRIKAKVFMKIYDNKKGLSFNTICSDVKINGPFIAGYPSIKLGNGIWAPHSGLDLGRSLDYKIMNVSAVWEFEVNGFANLAFDVWLTKDKGGFPKEDDVEIMVWLDYNFDLPHKVIAEDKDFIVKYYKKPKGDNLAGMHWISFIAKRKSGKIKFDLIKLVKLCENKIKDLGSYYIRSIDLGTEFSKNTKVAALIKKLDFDFRAVKR